jgi:phosphoribosylpyrophosphate synthetase
MAAVSHAPVTKETLRKISNSCLSCLITTNSVAGVEKLAATYPKIKVLDASGVFAEAY